MARTKPTAALSKILKAEQLRLQQLKHDLEFQCDVAELEATAKRLATGAPARVL